MHGHAPKNDKSNDFGKAMRQLIDYCSKYKFVVVFALILSVVATILNLMGPDKLSDMTDLITEGLMTGIDVDAVEKIAFILVAMYVAGFVFNMVQGFMMTCVTQVITKKMRRDISEKINRLPLRYFDSNTTGDMLSRVTNDVDTIGQTLNQSVGSIVSSGTLFVGSLFMMFKTNWIMTLAGVFASIIGFVLMFAIIGRSQKYFFMQQQQLGKLNGHIEETYTGHNVVKVYNGEKKANEEFNAMNEELYNCAWKGMFMSGLMQPLMGFIGNLGYVVVCVVGAALAMKDIIGFGSIVAFMMYIRFFTQPLSQLAQAANSLQSTAAASERIFEFLNEEELSDESQKTLKLDDVKGDVTFEHVKFGYTDDRIIVKDFSAHAKAGQKIAIVGPTGAGKTTMVNLLMRFYELNSGEILIDDTPISSLTRENIHDIFGMVLQDTWLFEGSVRDNIIYSKEGVTDEQLIKACKAVGIHRYIKSLPQGYDTILDDKANISQGQRQLMTIARAMIEDAPMLILDEATSSIDTRTEIVIQKAMDTLMKGRTSFVIAHRLSTIKNADLILVMNEGDVIESGNHEELMAKGGFYANLYNSQFEQAS